MQVGKNILGGHNMSLREIVTEVAKLAHRRPPKVRLPHTLVLPIAFAAEAWARLSGREPACTVDGVRLHYIDAGTGSPLVLLHGASASLRDFHASILPELARHHRVIAFDRPGYVFLLLIGQGGFYSRAGRMDQNP